MIIQESNVESFLNNNKIEGINSTEVKPVNMGSNAIATDDKPCLFTFGLSTCIGLVGLGENFAFLSHIDMGGLMGDQWETEYRQLPNGKWNVRTKGCKETRALYNAIYRNKDKIKTPIDIVLVEGICPVDKEDEHRRLLDSGLNSLESMCMRNLGISINRRTISSSSVLIDSRNRRIVLGDRQEIDMNDLFTDILPQYENTDGIDSAKKKISELCHQNTRDDNLKE